MIAKIKKTLQERESFKFNPEFSVQVGVIHKKKEHKFFFGKKYRFFDLASLTKPMIVGEYFVNNKKKLSLPISEVLPWLGKSNITLKDLLNHAAGLKAHEKFYKEIKSYPLEHREFELKIRLRSAVTNNTAKGQVKYSDLGYMLLGFCIEELEEKKLEVQFPFKNTLHFFPKKHLNKYAPTEQCGWRKQKIQGEVFDDNAFIVPHPMGHAGLFGTLDDMLGYGKHLANLYKKNKNYFKPQNTAWANGFMIPTGENSTAGKYFSKKSIGHLGFTGTSFWYDPEVDLYVVTLSNRTYPDRNKVNFNPDRRAIQNAVYEQFILDGKK